MESCPKELKPYDIAHKKKVMEQDYLQHLWWGNYGVSALSFAIDHCINGKKAKSKYMEKSLFEQMEDENKELSDYEIKKQRELFVANLEIMKANFEINHPKKESD